jgi:hypothetical protein
MICQRERRKAKRQVKAEQVATGDDTKCTADENVFCRGKCASACKMQEL